MVDSNFAATYLLPIVLGLIMFNIGLSLTVNDFKRIFLYPRGLFVGLIAQMIILPLIAFGIAHLSGLPPAIQVGIVIIAACPGGATSNLITYLLRGDVALSVSLTALNSLLVIFSIPFIVFLALKAFMGAGTYVELSFWDTIFKIFVMILIPTGSGVYFRSKYPKTSRFVEKKMKFISIALLAIIFTIAIVGNNQGTGTSLKPYLNVAPYVFFLNVLGMTAGFLMGRILKIRVTQQISLSVEVGIQNSALAITIASSSLFLNNFAMSIPAVVYGMFTFFSAVLFGLIIRKWFK